MKYDWVIVNDKGEEFNYTITTSRARTIRAFLRGAGAYSDWGDRLTPTERTQWRRHYRTGYRCRKFVKDFTCGVVK